MALVIKNLSANAGDIGAGLIPGLGRSPAGGRGNPLQYSCLENPLEQRNLLGYSPWRCKESDKTEARTNTHDLGCNVWVKLLGADLKPGERFL